MGLLALQSPNSGHEQYGIAQPISFDRNRRTYPTNSAVHGQGKRWLLQSRPLLLEKVSFKGCMNKSNCLFSYVWWIQHSNFIQFSDLIVLMQKKICFAIVVLLRCFPNDVFDQDSSWFILVSFLAVVVLLRATGDAPILKQTKFKVCIMSIFVSL